jgi:hypothetical protein
MKNVKVKEFFANNIATIIVPIVVTVVGVVGNNQLISYRLDQLEQSSADKSSVVSLEKQFNSYVLLQNKTNELLLKSLIRRGYLANSNNSSTITQEQNDIYVGYQANILLNEFKNAEITESVKADVAVPAEEKTGANK